MKESMIGSYGRRSSKRAAAIFMTMMLVMSMLSGTGVKGVKGAQEPDPYDTTQLELIASGEYNGALYYLYNNGLLCVGDNYNGGTAGQEKFVVRTLHTATGLPIGLGEIKYIYWNITAPVSGEGMFRDLRAESIVLGDHFLETSSNMTSTELMFYDTPYLKFCNLGDLNTSNVTDMSWMFSACGLDMIDLKGYNTSKVTRMDLMFYGCDASVIDVSKFNTSNVTNMSRMFAVANNIETIDVSGFDTSKVTNMGSMFSSCKSLKALDISNFDMSKVTNAGSMIQNCESLETVNISGLKFGDGADISGLVCYCPKLKSINLKGIDVSNVGDMSYFISRNNSLTYVDASDMVVPEGAIIDRVFKELKNLHVIKLPKSMPQYECELANTFCRLYDNKTVNRFETYDSIPATTGKSITLVNETNHRCTNVNNGVVTCDQCGVAIRFGDVYDDGIINVNDVIALKKYLVGLPVDGISIVSADVYYNGTINVDDAIVLMKYLVGLHPELGITY